MEPDRQYHDGQRRPSAPERQTPYCVGPRATGRETAGAAEKQTASRDAYGPLSKRGSRTSRGRNGTWEDATRFNLDHVAPRAAGGPDNVLNLVWSCRPCNQKKRDRPVAEFLQEHPERLTLVLGNKRAAGSRRPARRDLQDTAPAPESRRTRNRRNHRRRHRRRTPGSRTGQVPRQRRGVLRKQRKDRAAAESRTAEGNRPRPEETDQEAADRTVPGVAAPKACRTTNPGMPAARAPSEHRARSADRRNRPNREQGTLSAQARGGKSIEPASNGTKHEENDKHLKTRPDQARGAKMLVPTSKLAHYQRTT